jgi:hypothetical protein
MNASESDEPTSDKMSGRSKQEADLEERNTGSKEGWDERSSNL